MNWLCTAGREPGNPRAAGRSPSTTSWRSAARSRKASASPCCPTIWSARNRSSCTILPDYEVPSFDCFFVYPEELRDSARVTVFRDFLVANARRWNF